MALSASQARAQKPELPIEDIARLSQARHIAGHSGDRVWRRWSQAPFAVLLVTDDYEFLMGHPKPSADFTLWGGYPFFSGRIYYRKRVFAPNFLATFPAINGVSTIVVGQPQNTNVKDSTRWILTILHEHFHQWQDSRPNAFADYASLGLAHGDQTGMWMLNFPFPYDDPEVNRRFAALCGTLLETLSVDRKQKNEFRARLTAYLRERDEFRKALKTEDYRYFSFQLWKEGVARYTEYRAGESAWIAAAICEGLMGSGSGVYVGEKTTTILPPFCGDSKAYRQAAQDVFQEILGGLLKLSLKGDRRIAFYTFGAAEALLLDRANPHWHGQYFKQKFFLEGYFPAWARKAAGVPAHPSEAAGR